MKKLLASLFGSKKFVALLLGLVVTLVSYPLTRFAGMDPEAALALAAQIGDVVIALVGAYVVGQGLADLGKEKAKVVALADKEMRGVS